MLRRLLPLGLSLLIGLVALVLISVLAAGGRGGHKKNLEIISYDLDDFDDTLLPAVKNLHPSDETWQSSTFAVITNLQSAALFPLALCAWQSHFDTLSYCINTKLGNDFNFTTLPSKVFPSYPTKPIFFYGVNKSGSGLYETEFGLFDDPVFKYEQELDNSSHAGFQNFLALMPMAKVASATSCLVAAIALLASNILAAALVLTLKLQGRSSLWVMILSGVLAVAVAPLLTASAGLFENQARTLMGDKGGKWVLFDHPAEAKVVVRKGKVFFDIIWSAVTLCWISTGLNCIEIFTAGVNGHSSRSTEKDSFHLDNGASKESASDINQEP